MRLSHFDSANVVVMEFFDTDTTPGLYELVVEVRVAAYPDRRPLALLTDAQPFIADHRPLNRNFYPLFHF